jgi:hypothetical protein
MPRKGQFKSHCKNGHPNKVRGLLCSKCNQAIGLLKDSIVNCLAAAEYLKQYDSD